VALVALVALVATVASPVAAASAGASAVTGADGEHCVVHVVGQRHTGELVTSAPRCYPTLHAAMEGEHVRAWGAGAQEQAAALGASTFELGRHCDGANLGAPCTSTVGSSCTGGWLNASPTWNDRISSTLGGCPTIRHYDGANLTGGVEPTSFGIWNLTVLDNRTSSIQYL
jgi:hypothetical protein